MTDGLKGLSSLFVEISSNKIYYLLLFTIIFVYTYSCLCVLGLIILTWRKSAKLFLGRIN